MLRRVFLMAESVGNVNVSTILGQLRNWNGLIASEVQPGVVRLSIPTGGEGEPDIVLDLQIDESGQIIHISQAQ